MSEVALCFEKMHKTFKNKAQRCSTPLKGSNISDLLYDVLKQRGKSLEPLRWGEFFKGLARINVPEYLIGNPSRRAMIHKYKTKRGSGHSLEVDARYSPTPTTSSKKGTKRKRTGGKTKTSGRITWERL